MITEILPSAFSVLGLPVEDTLGLGSRIGPVRRIAVLLVDGLGYHLLPPAARSAPVLADILAGRAGRLEELACALPSTTPTSLVSLGTGVAPGEHGVLGFTVNVPGTDRVLTHIHWRDVPPPDVWQPVPTVFARAAASGIASAVVLPGGFGGSGLTQAAYGGADFIGLGHGDDLAATMLAALHEPGLVYGYTARVDTAAHAQGIASAEWAAAVAKTGVLIERLIAGLPPDAALLVTADHGGLDVPRAGRVDLGTDPRLSAGVRVVAGEPRFRYLHTDEGATADVADAWRGVLGDRASVLTRDEAVGGGLFGAVRPEHLARIGDVVVIPNDKTAILASGYEPAEVANLIGFHGGRRPEETAIPLISFAPDNPIA